MPIRQPIQTTIPTGDFRDKAYSFTVESVLMPQERAGMLTVGTSAGYMLITPVDKEPKREQTFEHVQQTDNTWLATGTLTLVATDDSLPNGRVIIRNSADELVLLTIEATSRSLAIAQEPMLTVSQPALAFARTSPGKPSYLVLTIAQHHTDAPVTLTTDAPELFQLASDSRPVFSPALTLTPSALGTYVHVRYSPPKNGLHTGQLIIHNQYEQKTVTLEGRSRRLVPTVRTNWPASSPAALRPPAVQRLLAHRSVQRVPVRLLVPKQWAGLLALVLMGGLAYAGYTYRYELFPALFTNTGQTVTQASVSFPEPAEANGTLEKVAPSPAVPKRAKARDGLKPVDPPSVRPIHAPSVDSPGQRTTATRTDKAYSMKTGRDEALTEEKRAKQNTDSQANNQTRRSTAPAPTAEESELERELNKNL